MENENLQKKSFAQQCRGIFYLNYMWTIIQMYFSSKKFVGYEIKYVNLSGGELLEIWLLKKF